MRHHPHSRDTIEVVVPDSLSLIIGNKLSEHALSELKESMPLVPIFYNLQENDSLSIHEKLEE